jgi:hypothetical protein
MSESAIERRAVDAFRDLSRQVDAAVADYRGPRHAAPTLDDVDRLLEGLADLKRSHPDGYRAAPTSAADLCPGRHPVVHSTRSERTRMPS